MKNSNPSNQTLWKTRILKIIETPVIWKFSIKTICKLSGLSRNWTIWKLSKPPSNFPVNPATFHGIQKLSRQFRLFPDPQAIWKLQRPCTNFPRTHFQDHPETFSHTKPFQTIQKLPKSPSNFPDHLEIFHPNYLATFRKINSLENF